MSVVYFYKKIFNRLNVILRIADSRKKCQIDVEKMKCIYNW